jgi:hypothetical protein
MWEGITVKGKLEEVIAAYKNGTTIWCTDGSYHRVVMPDISSAGWTIFDPLITSHIRGSFFEVTGPAASAYRVACAFAELYGGTEHRNRIICDNEKALWKSKVLRTRRISPSMKHADLLRLLRNI